MSRRDIPGYNSWCSMKKRCYNPNISDFKNYGGRGIKVCDRWRDSFDNFYEDMGPKPTPDHQIDRIDNDGNYEPGNCRWTTRSENQHNKRQYRNNASGVKGVSYVTRDNVWRASLRSNGKRHQKVFPLKTQAILHRRQLEFLHMTGQL